MENLLGALICYDLAVAVRDGFNLETAVGAQLDIIAKYVGVNRVITGIAFTREYFGYALYGDTSPFDFNPYIKYGDAIPDVQFRNYKESSQSLYALNDEELRIIIKLAILRNNSNASVKDIDTLLDQLFGAEVYFIDRMNMTVVSYMLSTAYARIFNIAKSSGLLPNPAGVGTSLVIVPDIENIFAYSLYGGEKPSFAVGYVDYFAKWGVLGNYLQLSISAYTIYNSQSALSSSRIAFWNNSPGRLQAYDFDGTNWAPVGNYLQLSAPVYNSQSALSSSRIAFFNSTDGRLQAYDFDGTDWTPVGNYLQLSVGYSTSQSALSSSRIAFFDSADGILQAYDFDGTNWTAKGNALAITGIFTSMATFSSSRIAFYNTTLGILQSYDFDGTDWTAWGNDLAITASRSSMAALSSSSISFFNATSNILQSYDFIRDLTGCMASYS
jgi:hypothetical protein